MPAEITFNGWNEFRQKAKSLPDVVFEEIDGEVQEGAQHWEQLAKQSAPVDQGNLVQHITNNQKSLMHWNVNSQSEISAIMEWGAGDYVIVPPELQKYAEQFKKKPTGGTRAEAQKRIREWVRRKGIQFKGLTVEETGDVIFYHIMVHGVRPHPFFFIHVPVIEKEVFERVKTILTTAH